MIESQGSRTERAAARPGARLPTFLIIGAMRSGTTSLYRYLGGHPEIYVSPRKELNFFSLDEVWNRGVSWYAAQFAGAGDAAAVGEATPRYSQYPLVPGVPARIAATVPDVRLIYLMRDPVERMVSEYGYRYARLWEHRPIREALLRDTEYWVKSSYALQIRKYLEHFDRSSILLVPSEDLRDRRVETLGRVLEFLGVSTSWVPPNIDVETNRPPDRRPNWLLRRAGKWVFRTERAVSKGSPPRRRIPPRLRRAMSRPIRASDVAIDDATRAALRDVIRADVAELAAFMPPGFRGWGLL